MKTSSCTLCIQHCTLHNTTRREGSKEGHADFFPFVEISPDEYFRFSLAGFHVRLRLDDIANLLGRAWVPVIEVSVAQLLENLASYFSIFLLLGKVAHDEDEVKTTQQRIRQADVLLHFLGAAEIHVS